MNINDFYSCKPQRILEGKSMTVNNIHLKCTDDYCQHFIGQTLSLLVFMNE